VLAGLQPLNIPYYSDWLEVGSAVFSILTFIIALVISRGQGKSSKRFISSQVFEKIAVLYAYADTFNEVVRKNREEMQKNSAVRHAIPPHLLERISTDLTSVGNIAEDTPKEDRKPLSVAMAKLVSEMKEAGYGADGERLERLFKSFFATTQGTG